MSNKIGNEHKREITERGYRAAVARLRQRDGELEFDEDAIVSVSDDAGAYVQGWAWIDDEDVTDTEAKMEERHNPSMRELREPLEQIQKILSGKEWSADTPDEIARVMDAAGWTIEPYNPDDKEA